MTRRCAWPTLTIRSQAGQKWAQSAHIISMRVTLDAVMVISVVTGAGLDVQSIAIHKAVAVESALVQSNLQIR